uniref:NADH dehydrogenase subunit 4 n=1 Tax=Caliscelis shandongensis TaxID=2886254 RepID=UPI001E7D09F4|nr:NADH dehydrogenase subunit 4 [Caliscelis shandongensis]UDL72118.1 NADH dehydrogenase subunit 4 [Caliscelis shandongensis]
MLKVLFYLMSLIPISFVNGFLIYYVYSLFFFFFFFFLYMNLFLFDYFYYISYIFGIDSVSYLFCCLSIWICLLICLGVFNMNLYYENYFLFYVNFLLIMLIVVFSVMDFFYFYFFFECSMIPVFLVLFGWGYQPERLNAGFYLIFYTLFASLPLFILILYVIYFFGSFSYFLDLKFKSCLFMFFMIFSFLVKFPMFGFHLWLPSAHVEAPFMGSMILAGILLKLGGYGLIRLMSFIYFYVFFYGDFIISLSLVGCLLVSMFCMIQSDVKILIAYSSVCHMSMVIVGLFTLNSWGNLGSLIFMLGHGFVSSGLFYIIGVLYDRFGSRSFYILKGLINFFPSLSFFMFIFCIMNMSCPPSINLFSEIFISISLVSWSLFCMFFIFFILFFSACYSLMIFFLTQHGSYSGLLSFGSFFFVRDYLILFMHIFPVFFLVFDLSFFF